MFIRRLYLEGFRNYRRADLEWHARINLLSGLNAQGKSNLLEAVTYLSLTTSFRAAAEPELLGWDAPHFFVEGQIESEREGSFTVSAAYDRDKNKRWRLNGQPQTRKSDLVGLFHTVIFSPEDVDLVKAGPGERRRFLNRQISQLYPEHLRHLLRYHKVLSQRNSCLRQEADQQLEIWDAQLAELGAAVIFRRRQVLRELTPLAAALHAELSGGEALDLRYKSFAGAAQAVNTEEIQALFLLELQRLRPAELARGSTLIGPHRDDLLVYINGEPAKAYASQGQQRTVALSLKLAELELAREHKGEWPALLLDDVLSELDEKRQKALLQHLDGDIQTFITSAGPVPALPEGRVWIIEDGNIKTGTF